MLALVSRSQIAEHTARAASGVSVQYAAGWNLVGGPAGTVFGAPGSAYSLGPSDSAYVGTPGTAPVEQGRGYWVFFPAATSVTLNGVGVDSLTIQAPAGRWITIGNPSGTRVATVSGADTVLTWDATGGQYRTAGLLQVGQGAWAFSQAGATLTLTGTGMPLPISTATPAPSLATATAASNIAPLTVDIQAICDTPHSVLAVAITVISTGGSLEGAQFKGSVELLSQDTSVNGETFPFGPHPVPASGKVLDVIQITPPVPAGVSATVQVDVTSGSDHASGLDKCMF
jgi:hypothetical protein